MGDGHPIWETHSFTIVCGSVCRTMQDLVNFFKKCSGSELNFKNMNIFRVFQILATVSC
jgi:uncharacterized protein YsxB (DUF464 family)